MIILSSTTFIIQLLSERVLRKCCIKSFFLNFAKFSEVFPMMTSFQSLVKVLILFIFLSRDGISFWDDFIPVFKTEMKVLPEMKMWKIMMLFSKQIECFSFVQIWIWTSKICADKNEVTKWIQKMKFLNTFSIILGLS